MPELVFTLNQAKVRLYPVLEDGDPDINNPIWENSDAESVKVSARWDEVRLTPTGVRHPIIKQIHLRHELTIDRLWKVSQPLDPDEADIDFQLPRNPSWCLSIIWQQDDDDQRYIGRMYYGVTSNTYDFASRDMMESLANQAFQAQYFLPFNGKGAPACV